MKADPFDRNGSDSSETDPFLDDPEDFQPTVVLRDDEVPDKETEREPTYPLLRHKDYWSSFERDC